MFYLHKAPSKPEERVFRVDVYTVNFDGQYHDDVRTTVLRISWYEGTHPNRMNAVLRDPKNQKS